MEITKGKTKRNFDIIEFKDRYDSQCSIQKSSLATEDAIWLGIDDVDPKIMDKVKGWIKCQLPDGVLLTTRMHLTQGQVIELLPILQKFADTGEL